MSDSQFVDIDLDALVADNADSNALSLPASNLINKLGAQIAATMSPIDLAQDLGQQKMLFGFFMDNSPSMDWHEMCGDKSWRTLINQFNRFSQLLLDKGVEPTAEILPFLMNPYPRYVQRVTGDRTQTEFTWQTLSAAPKLIVPSSENEFLTGGTPLNGRARVFVGSVKARALYYQQVENINARSVSIIHTDGASTESDADIARFADECALLVRELRKDRQHRVLFLAYDDGSTNFMSVGKRMGIPEHDIRVISPNTDELAEFILAVSQLSATASQIGGPIDNIKL